jgi:hypothetical protein
MEGKFLKGIKEQEENRRKKRETRMVELRSEAERLLDQHNGDLVAAARDRAANRACVNKATRNARSGKLQRASGAQSEKGHQPSFFTDVPQRRRRHAVGNAHHRSVHRRLLSQATSESDLNAIRRKVGRQSWTAPDSQ